MSTVERFYPIGTPGQAWTPADKAAWLAQRSIQRSYADEVRRKLDALPPAFTVEQRGRESRSRMREICTSGSVGGLGRP